MDRRIGSSQLELRDPRSQNRDPGHPVSWVSRKEKCNSEGAFSSWDVLSPPYGCAMNMGTRCEKQILRSPPPN